MNVELDVAVLYHGKKIFLFFFSFLFITAVVIHTNKADPKKIRDLYLGIGESYENILVLPELQSAVRGFTSEVSLSFGSLFV